MIAIATLPKAGWKDNGNCAGIDPEWFFDEDNDEATVQVAKSLCDGCPVRDLCLSYALVADERLGVWGGTGEKERWNLAGRLHGSARLASRGCKCSPCLDTREIQRNIRAASV